MLEDLIKQVHSRGLLINNLFQLDERRWQANVTDQHRYWEFGQGQSPQDALRAALFKVDTTSPELVMDRPIRTDYQQPKPVISGNIADIQLPADRKFEL